MSSHNLPRGLTEQGLSYAASADNAEDGETFRCVLTETMPCYTVKETVQVA
ncbi:MAG: hypothetical protein LBO67_04210 [Spirochaetaceae bacterium]|jgi:hypothetical protein|nr:hypothetical protein [Spirochaetaceae bacterium]